MLLPPFFLFLLWVLWSKNYNFDYSMIYIIKLTLTNLYEMYFYKSKFKTNFEKPTQNQILVFFLKKLIFSKFEKKTLD